MGEGAIADEHLRFGTALRAARLARDLTQEQLARELATTLSNLRNYETGRYEPNWSFVRRCILFFGWQWPWVQEME
jgi:ribosome-binding protein aMBF1 (putative translation factor)